MTEQEINKAVARELDYYVIQDDSGSGFKLCHPTRTDIRYSWKDYESEAWSDAGEYATDYTAAAEMRKAINAPALKVDFLNTLRGILNRKFKRAISDYDLLNAEPAEQAEAFLRIVRKWKSTSQNEAP